MKEVEMFFIAKTENEKQKEKCENTRLLCYHSIAPYLSNKDTTLQQSLNNFMPFSWDVIDNNINNNKPLNNEIDHTFDRFLKSL
jgi:hypothetical protein